MASYIIAYRELIKFCDNLGKVFAFAAVDLRDKLNNLDRCLKEDKDNYVTIPRAISYEESTQIHMIDANATLSLLRLHRGLDLIKKVIEGVKESLKNESMRSQDI